MTTPKKYPDESSGRLKLATQLSLEWRRMARQAHNCQRANSWGLAGDPVSHLEEILFRCGFETVTNEDHYDNYLAELTAVAHGDDLATRIVLQRIMPGLIAIAVKRAPITSGGLPSAFDQVISAAWVVIRNFPIDRRPQRVAANLLMDIEYLAFVRDSRLKAHSCEKQFAPSGMLGVEFGRLRVGDIAADPVGNSGGVESMLHGLSHSGLTDRDIQMLRAVSQDVNSVEASAALGIAPRSIRNRRENALRKARRALTN